MNRRQRRGVSLATLLATFAGVSLILMTLVLGAGAAAGTVINTTSNTTAIGGTTTTTTSVSYTDPGDAALNGFNITISFDATVATVASVSPVGSWAFFPAPVIDNSVGGHTVRVTGVIANDPPGCTSPCALFTISWTGVGAGVSHLNQVVVPPDHVLAVVGGANTSYTFNNSATVTVTGPTATNTNTPVTPATNTPVTPATNTPVTPATNTPVTPGTSTPVTPGTATNTPVTPATNTPVTPVGTGTTTPQATASGSNTPVPTSTPVTSTPTPTPIPGGPRTYKLYLPEVADDGIPGSGQLVRALSEGVVGRVLGPLLGN